MPFPVISALARIHAMEPSGLSDNHPRPRERMLRWGPTTLSDAELLEVLLSPGTASHPARRIALSIHGAWPSLSELRARPPREMAEVPGVGLAKACRLAAALELGQRLRTERLTTPVFDGPEAVWERYRHLAMEDVETVAVVALNSKHQVLREGAVARGSATRCGISPREIFAPALREGATGVLLLHSHPSGDPEPSREDIAFTARLIRAGEVVGVAVLDHIVIGREGYVSLAERGLMVP
jgi:DNA repair protein RadC